MEYSDVYRREDKEFKPLCESVKELVRNWESIDDRNWKGKGRELMEQNKKELGSNLRKKLGNNQTETHARMQQFYPIRIPNISG